MLRLQNFIVVTAIKECAHYDILDSDTEISLWEQEEK